MAPWPLGIDPSLHTVIGVDEAGRGPLAGPVVAAGVILDVNKPISGLNDSKKLSEKMRDSLYDHIMEHAQFVSVEEISADIIDRINILQATLLAMKRVVTAAVLIHSVDIALIDGNTLIPDLSIKQIAVVNGDSQIESIMAASIIAKVHRDRLMKKFDAEWPGYGFGQHKGYGTKDHFAAIDRLGPSAIHRMSFSPLKGWG